MNEKSKNIVLTGFRATGKSLVGKLLAERLGYTFIDADILLCQRLGAPIAAIVDRHGWPFFRQAERRLLAEVPGMEETVVATGGGAIEHEEEWQRIRTCCYVVWLDADAATIKQRLQDDPKSSGQRPSLTGGAVCDEIDDVLRRRTPLYAAGSDLHLDTVCCTPEDLVQRIIDQMRMHTHTTNRSFAGMSSTRLASSNDTREKM
jgi:shikimate kinase